MNPKLRAMPVKAMTPKTKNSPVLLATLRSSNIHTTLMKYVISNPTQNPQAVDNK